MRFEIWNSPKHPTRLFIKCNTIDIFKLPVFKYALANTSPAKKAKIPCKRLKCPSAKINDEQVRANIVPNLLEKSISPFLKNSSSKKAGTNANVKHNNKFVKNEPSKFKFKILFISYSTPINSVTAGSIV